jgi:predicted amidophosphoribosyltransferase
MQLSATLPARFRRIGRAISDGVLPPRCLACGATVGEPNALCSQCWASMTFFAPPWCGKYGYV